MLNDHPKLSLDTSAVIRHIQAHPVPFANAHAGLDMADVLELLFGCPPSLPSHAFADIAPTFPAMFWA